MYSMMESDIDQIFGIKPVEPRSLTLLSFQDAQAKLRRATKTPQMVVCHPDKYDEVYAAMEEAGALRLGAWVKASDHMTYPETVYMIWDMEVDDALAIGIFFDIADGSHFHAGESKTKSEASVASKDTNFGERIHIYSPYPLNPLPVLTGWRWAPACCPFRWRFSQFLRYKFLSLCLLAETCDIAKSIWKAASGTSL